MRILIAVISCFMLTISSARASKWEGEWDFERNSRELSGFLNIHNCQNKICKFELWTSNGGFNCRIEDGTLNIDKNIAYYMENDVASEDNYEIKFNLDSENMIINAQTAKEANQKYCASRGYPQIDGMYENKKNIHYYTSSIKCINKDLTDAERYICLSKRLSLADLELMKIYDSARTPSWFYSRNQCGSNEQCLSDLYTETLKLAYENANNKAFDMHEYLLQNKKYSKFPTDFFLIDNYLRENMSKDDYEGWTVSLVSASKHDCSECFSYSYKDPGLAGEYSSIFYANKTGIWIAFISANIQTPQFVIVYMPPSATEKELPPIINEEIKYLSGFSNIKGIKYKNFKN